MYKILVINPGSTSTKAAVYENMEQKVLLTMRHSAEELLAFPDIMSQLGFRRDIILDELAKADVDIASFDIVMGRGGVLKPIPSGIYEVDDVLAGDLVNSAREHASNLGGLLAREIAAKAGVKAYIADPVVVDELEDVVRITGRPEIRRVSIFHALNQKAVARRYAKSAGRVYEEMNLIVAHIGGGISIGAHRQGRVVDVNNALDGEGPFSPERAGSLPVGALAAMCFSGEYPFTEVKRMLTGKGGLVGLLGTNNVQEVLARAADGDRQAAEALEAMSYQIGKSIGAAAAVLHGRADAVILTGGVAHSPEVTGYITEMVSFIAPVAVIPGEDEMEALASNAMRLMAGEAAALDYALQSAGK